MEPPHLALTSLARLLLPHYDHADHEFDVVSSAVHRGDSLRVAPPKAPTEGLELVSLHPEGDQNNRILPGPIQARRVTSGT